MREYTKQAGMQILTHTHAGKQKDSQGRLERNSGSEIEKLSSLMKQEKRKNKQNIQWDNTNKQNKKTDSSKTTNRQIYLPKHLNPFP